MVNKPFWNISDFVLASYTFGCVKNCLLSFEENGDWRASRAPKIYGDAALSETTCRHWFRRFKDGDFDVDDRPRGGRPKTFEDAEWGKIRQVYPPENFLLISKGKSQAFF